MRKNPFFLSIALSVLTGLMCAGMVLMDTFAPIISLPAWDLTLMAVPSLGALVLTRYFAGNTPGAENILPGGIALALLPLCAGLVPLAEAWKILIAGTLLFGVLTALYSSLQRRMTGKAAPAVVGFVLFLACQFLQGIL